MLKKNKKNHSYEIGTQAEERANQFLFKKGLRLLRKNFRSRTGELDLIMQEGDTIVFVEVRYRNNSDFGTGIETITQYKKKRLIKTALYYLHQQRLTDRVCCRFDVVALTSCSDQVLWIKNAFEDFQQ